MCKNEKQFPSDISEFYLRCFSRFVMKNITQRFFHFVSLHIERMGNHKRTSVVHAVKFCVKIFEKSVYYK